MLVAEDPKITDWMQAWGSIAGLVMSTIAVLLTGLLFRHEIRVRREERRASEATQARLVLPLLTQFTNEVGRDSGEYKSVRWQVTNHSDAPILALTAELRLRDYTSAVSQTDTIPVLSGTLEGSFPFDEPFWNSFGQHPAKIFSIAIHFTDSDGLNWTRVDYDPPQRAE
ncbi:hypothetical protein AB0B57_02660 [Micromonospora sp. NPDC049101]|uniref:hypothetical protein n=1 Tax=Micromonospora sp. NPDC049101 TaxID=3155032 RepID=UPI0033E7DEED